MGTLVDTRTVWRTTKECVRYLVRRYGSAGEWGGEQAH